MKSGLMKAELYINGQLVNPKDIPESERDTVTYQIVQEFLALTRAKKKDIPRIKALSEVLHQDFTEVFKFDG